MTSPGSSGRLFDSHSETTVTGVVRRVVYSSTDSGWTVLRVRRHDGLGDLTAVGPMEGVQPGEDVHLTGEWTQDSKFGRQFRVIACLRQQPSSLEGIVSYLGSGLIPGIGRSMARRLVDRFGLDTLTIISRHPERLTEVSGIGPARAHRIERAWKSQEATREIFIFLQGHGITPAQARRIYRHYGDRAISALTENPYRLAREVFGFGFPTTDRIAESLGTAPDAPARAEAGVVHVLAEAEDRGHVFLPRGLLEQRGAKLLGLSVAAVSAAVDRLTRRGALVADLTSTPGSEPAIYRRMQFEAENGLAGDLAGFAHRRSDSDRTLLHSALRLIHDRDGLSLSPEQHNALQQLLTHRLLVITGGPGTGKTTLVRAIAALQQVLGRDLQLAAPTGRAAKRLTEATAVEARTVHRLLEFEPHSGNFARNRDRRLPDGTILVDEASMLDCQLAFRLVEAISDSSQLILVGDVDQLPSVGAGRVLADVIRSGMVPVTRLQKVFRQAATSSIIANAHRIRRGELPQFSNEPDSDFYFVQRDEPADILATIEEMLTVRIPRRFGFDVRRDLQVLTPMRRGPLGVDRLNSLLQMLLNPSSSPIGDGSLRIGDRVMQIRNNYDLDVYNGDIGVILRHDPSDNSIEVLFEDRTVTYTEEVRDELTLAYACSVHKAQGSEYPCIIMPIHEQHTVMLQRNLLYTALTRASRLAILVGQRRAVSKAVANDLPQRRFTGLTERLRSN